MYAIVEIAGQQFKVEEGKQIFVHRLEGNEGDKVEFNQVLFKADGDKVSVGTPTLKSKVSAKIVEHLKGDKVIVFKKKRRKGYKVKNGHRQYLTKVAIEKIS
ncbi:MAG: 50S ribosomal protein L21 [Chitinophagales bacterium]|jgi:large subunit ribosomal protein L21|nr:50S ribosomal protein L21 [Chitinophagales bacterium]MDC3209724.1 50S ribosomal protein L21 [Chitinophagales bacterium]|tara:strand:- start:320 stop:625 length:306 start_codon:yes stop_codon:yes gene_type:complete